MFISNKNELNLSVLVKLYYKKMMMKIMVVMKNKLKKLRLIRKRQLQSQVTMYTLSGLMTKTPPNNNSEVLFRSSNDGGITFADRINLSNTTSADTINAGIAADGSNVIVTWRERNATSEEPVVTQSNDNGSTFGPVLKLTTN
jgi:hypothetical protein